MTFPVAKLGEVCSFVRGLTYSKSDEVEFSSNVVVRATNIDLSTHKLDFNELRYISDSIQVKDEKRLKKNDILICTASGSKSHLGKVALVESDLGMSFGGFMGALRVNPQRITPHYLFTFLMSSEFKRHIESLSDGANINNLKFSQIEQLELPLPPLATQKKIVAKLDAIFAEIDKATAAAVANAKNAEALFQSYLTQVIESGSEGWREFQIKELGKVVTGNTPTTSEPKNYGDFISFVKPGDFNSDGTIDLEKQKLSQIGMSVSRVVKEKSALMVCIGATIGKCGFVDVDVVTNQQINSVTPNSDFSHKFIYLQMLTSSFQKKILDSSGQATLPIINKSKWESLTMKFPPLSKQIEIVERFENLRFETVNLKNSQIEKIKNCHQLKQSILKKAFAGELVKE